MTSQERDQIRSLGEKMDNLPDIIMARLDDRYLKKDDAPDQYFTRLEGKAATWVISFSVVVLGLWQVIETFFTKKP